MPPPPITQESGSHPGLVDGDAVGQIEVLELFAQLVGGDRPPAGMDDRRVGRVSRMHQVGAAIVIALLGVERTDDVHVMHLLGHPGHVLADLHSRRRGVDRPEGVLGIVRVLEQKIDQLLPLVGLPGLEKRPGLLDVGNPAQQVKVGSSQVFLVGRRFRRIHTRFLPGTFQQPVDETSAPLALALLGARSVWDGPPRPVSDRHP